MLRLGQAAKGEELSAYQADPRPRRTRSRRSHTSTKEVTVTPEVVALIQHAMHLTDTELAEIAKDPEQLEALLDVIFDDTVSSSADRSLLDVET